jgi:hypothetical protein
MLLDGAIDQTFAFQRTTHIQLQSSKPQLEDKLKEQVSQPEEYMLRTVNEYLRCQHVTFSSLVRDAKTGSLLAAVCSKTGVAVQ